MKIYVDGSQKTSLGGFIVVTDGNGQLIRKKSFKATLTSNELEYLAIINALEFCEPGDEIYSDSQLCVKQLTGQYSVKTEHLKKYYTEAIEIIKKKKIKLIWIPRDQNKAGKYIEDLLKKHAQRKPKNKYRKGNTQTTSVHKPNI